LTLVLAALAEGNTCGESQTSYRTWFSGKRGKP